MKTLFLALYTLLGISCFAQQKIEGRVFNDLNSNGALDKNEKGIANVSVSNGVDVVQTDHKGRYSLALDSNQVLFISKPAGYACANGKYMLPQFYYIHKPNGSPKHLAYKGSDATGKLPKKINFPLTATAQRDTFSAFVAGDPQPSNKKELDYYRDDILSAMLNEKASLYIALGDIMNNDLSLYNNYNDMVAQLGVPAYNVYGNHDVNFLAQNNTHAAETFVKNFGPSYYSYNYGQVHFVNLNNIDYKGWNDSLKTSKGYRGLFGKTQLNWLAKDLEFVPNDRLLVFSMHIPIKSEVYDGESVSVYDAWEFFELIKDRPNVLILAGHMHLVEHYKFGKKDGWKGKADLWQITAGAGCGSWWKGPLDTRNIPVSTCYDGVPNGFYLFTFEGNKFAFRYIPADKPKTFQLRINSPRGSIALDSLGTSHIEVNVFNASPLTHVEAQIGNKTIQLKAVQTEDSHMKALLKRYENVHYPTTINLPKSTHIFTGKLPQGLAKGNHIIRIKTHDPLKNHYTGQAYFEVK